jgi:hypothetical protein
MRRRLAFIKCRDSHASNQKPESKMRERDTFVVVELILKFLVGPLIVFGLGWAGTTVSETYTDARQKAELELRQAELAVNLIRDTSGNTNLRWWAFDMLESVGYISRKSVAGRQLFIDCIGVTGVDYAIGFDTIYTTAQDISLTIGGDTALAKNWKIRIGDAGLENQYLFLDSENQAEAQLNTDLIKNYLVDRQRTNILLSISIEYDVIGCDESIAGNSYDLAFLIKDGENPICPFPKQGRRSTEFTSGHVVMWLFIEYEPKEEEL